MSFDIGWDWWDRIKANINKEDSRRQAEINKAFAPKPKPSSPAPAKITKETYAARVALFARNIAQGGPVSVAHLKIAKDLTDQDLKRTNTTVMGAASSPQSSSSPQDTHKALKAAAVVAAGGTALFFLAKGFLKSSEAEDGSPWSPVRYR